MLREIENSANLGAKDEEHLGGGPHREHLHGAVPGRRDSTTLQRKRQMAAGAKSFGYHYVSSAKRFFDSAERGLDVLKNIVGPFLMHERRAGRGSALGIDDSLHFFIFDLDQFSRLVRQRA